MGVDIGGFAGGCTGAAVMGGAVDTRGRGI